MALAKPETRRGDDESVLHGEHIADPYRWLEQAAQPDVQQWMREQDTFARAKLGDLPERSALLDRCRELFYFDAVSCPERRGARLFFSRKLAHREKSAVYWRADSTEHVLLDPTAMSDDGTMSLGVWKPSPSGDLVVYAVHENNADAASLKIRDVVTGVDLDDYIEGAKYADPSWLPDDSGFYYTRLPVDSDIETADLPGRAELCFHSVGEDAALDRVVRECTRDPQTFLHGEVSQDGRWLVVNVQHGWNSTDVYLADLTKADDDFVTVAEGVDALFEMQIWAGQMYIHTDEDAPRYRVMRASTLQPERGHWKELVAESADALESVHVFGGNLVCRYLKNAASELRLFGLDGAPKRIIELPGIGTVDTVTGAPDDDRAFFSYSSFTEPTRIVEFGIEPGDAPREWARVHLDFDGDSIACDQVHFVSKDGTQIPMFVLRRRDVAPSGDLPTVLYGYGGFNVSLTPSFSPAVLPWLERGGVYAVANLRGGGEFGEAWHRAGMGACKQNVFDDFLAAADFLVDAGWTRPDRLAIRGGSNGGLLVGAVMTQRPQAFGAVICAVPLLDMLRYHLFGSGRTWIPEYGSAEDEAQFRALHRYSPLHNLHENVNYPALLMLAADSDDRVDPMHARKFVAAVQHASANQRPALLRIERNAGHGGADMVARQVEQTADTYAFLLEHLGVS